MSSEDIDRGARWFADIGKQLETTNFGIICVTPKSRNAPWLLFEAGALSKTLNQSRVSPLLLGMSNAELKGPLAQFNTTSIEKKDFWKLVKTINSRLDSLKLDEKILNKSFEKWCPDIETTLNESSKEAAEEHLSESGKPIRSDRDILEEILINNAYSMPFGR